MLLLKSQKLEKVNDEKLPEIIHLKNSFFSLIKFWQRRHYRRLHKLT